MKKCHEHFDPLYPGEEAKIDECMYKTQKICRAPLAAGRTDSV